MWCFVEAPPRRDRSSEAGRRRWLHIETVEWGLGARAGRAIIGGSEADMSFPLVRAKMAQ